MDARPLNRPPFVPDDTSDVALTQALQGLARYLEDTEGGSGDSSWWPGWYVSDGFITPRAPGRVRQLWRFTAFVERTGGGLALTAHALSEYGFDAMAPDARAIEAALDDGCARLRATVETGRFAARSPPVFYRHIDVVCARVLTSTTPTTVARDARQLLRRLRQMLRGSADRLGDLPGVTILGSGINWF